jgi:hypothetical protein
MLKGMLNKVKPDQVLYDGSGKVVGEPFYSKAKLDERKKFLEGFGRFDSALSTALSEGTAESFVKLKEALDKTKSLLNKDGSTPQGNGE